ncbi:Defensin-like protein 2 [Nymphaea thermarum]|nr:Defensin-like protein 2 [Nymphaea thermarum]
MEMKKSVLPVLLLLLLLVATPNMTNTAEARTCESQSHQFKGRCFSDHNCGMVCRNEGFFGGNCRGFRGRCFCTKPC